MSKGRLEAFSDGVIAILITIMVLELRPPTGDQLSDLDPLIPVFISYALSFVNLGIYWNNHHHLFQAAKLVDGRVLWSNMLLLFWLSLFPFGTAWMGQTNFASVPTAIYGVVLALAGVSYYILVRALIAVDGQAPTLAAAIGSDRKGIVSVLIYLVAMPIAWSIRSSPSACTCWWRSSGSCPTGVSSGPCRADQPPVVGGSVLGYAVSPPTEKRIRSRLPLPSMRMRLLTMSSATQGGCRRQPATLGDDGLDDDVLAGLQEGRAIGSGR